MANELVMVDKNHRRHRAVISRIRVPINGKIYDGEIAATVCGRFLRHAQPAENYSYYDTAGDRHTQACAVCLPDEVVVVSEADGGGDGN